MVALERDARRAAVNAIAITAIAMGLSACAKSAPPPPPVATPAPPPPAAPPVAVEPPPLEPLPDVFESPSYIVRTVKPGDTAASLAERYLGGAGRAWMIEEYAGRQAIQPDTEVVIPKRDWNPPGVYPSGYQLVPVLVYHNIAPQRKGRLTIGAATFEEQIRYLKAEGFYSIGLDEFVDFLQQRRQLPKKSVLLTFDDGHKGFLQYAYPVIKAAGFRVVLFIQTDQISSRPNANSLSWPELQELAKEGVVVQAHTKTHGDLRKKAGESPDAYARRMQAELGAPLDLLRKNLPRPAGAPETVAYPFGEADDEVVRYVKQYGYVAGFTVQRRSNPAFVPLALIGRSQVYSDWSAEDFKKNLNLFRAETPLPVAGDGPGDGPPATATAQPTPRGRAASRYVERAAQLERAGDLRAALDECGVALTIDPTNAAAQAQQRRLDARIESGVATRMKEGQRLARTSPDDAARQFTAVLALDPLNQAAFQALRDAPRAGRFLTHTVRGRETAESLADLYYGDRSRADLIEQVNGIEPGAALVPGRALKIPEIPGVPFLRPDR